LASREQPPNCAAMDLEAFGKVTNPGATFVGQDEIVHGAALESSLDLPNQLVDHHSLAGLSVVMTCPISQLGV
jgi:hypothetical protein